MAITWTNEYMNQPRQGSNPGAIAQSVRTLKSAIFNRLFKEHYWGPEEGVIAGKHKEGSTKVFIEDTESAQRITDGDRIASDGEIGRTRVNLTERNPVPKSGDIDIIGDGIYENTIEVWDKDNTVVKVFDPDDYVHRDWDLNITGRKVYTGENPEVQEDLSDTQYDDIMTGPEQLRADQKAVKRQGIKIWTEEARTFNIFDSSDDDNTTIPDTNSPTLKVVTENIEAQSIYGTIVRGAVWG